MSYYAGFLKRLFRSPARVTLRFVEVLGALVFLSRPFQALHALILTRRKPVALVEGHFAVVAHVFYPELWPEIFEVWSALPVGSHLIVTTTIEKATEIRAAAQGVPLVEIYECENRGRDLGPFVSLLSAGVLDRFDVILKVHTKKSPHLVQGHLRRKLLFAALAGSKANVQRILAHFTDRYVGLVGLAPLFRTARSFLMSNGEVVERLCNRMHPKGMPAVGFFEGSMFWVRPAALTPIRSASIRMHEFEAEAGQLDGTLHHGLERVIAISAQAAGFDTLSIRGRPLMGGRRIANEGHCGVNGCRDGRAPNAIG